MLVPNVTIWNVKLQVTVFIIEKMAKTIENLTYKRCNCIGNTRIANRRKNLMSFYSQFFHFQRKKTRCGNLKTHNL